MTKNRPCGENISRHIFDEIQQNRPVQNSRFLSILVWISENFHHNSRVHLLATVVYINQWIINNILNVDSTGFQRSHASWKILEFLFENFQDLESPGKWPWSWKVLEIYLQGPGKSWNSEGPIRGSQTIKTTGHRPALTSQGTAAGRHVVTWSDHSEHGF